LVPSRRMACLLGGLSGRWSQAGSAPVGAVEMHGLPPWVCVIGGCGRGSAPVGAVETHGSPPWLSAGSWSEWALSPSWCRRDAWLTSLRVRMIGGRRRGSAPVGAIETHVDHPLSTSGGRGCGTGPGRCRLGLTAHTPSLGEAFSTRTRRRGGVRDVAAPYGRTQPRFTPVRRDTAVGRNSS